MMGLCVRVCLCQWYLAVSRFGSVVVTVRSESPPTGRPTVKLSQVVSSPHASLTELLLRIACTHHSAVS